MSAPKIKPMAEVTLAYPVQDLDRSIAWYEEMLGFTLLYRNDEVGWCELRTTVEGCNVGLGKTDTCKVEGGATATWGVEDLDSARRELEAAGVKVDETIEIPNMVKLATFYDPDGNHLMLFQLLSTAETPPQS